MLFRGNEHKVIYTSILKKINKPVYKISLEFLSALYLLTSYTKLWNKVKNAVEVVKIDFSKISLKNLNPDCYILCKATQDLYEGTNHISFLDLADSDDINERIYKLILNALEIKRKGSNAFRLKAEERFNDEKKFGGNNEMNYDKRRVEMIRSFYPAGSRIELISFCNYEEHSC